MTPQLQQAIKLLQLSNLELTEYVESELQENPMLERDEGGRREQDAESAPEADSSGSEESESAALESIDFTAAQPAEISTESGPDVDYDNDYTNNGNSDIGGEAYGPMPEPAFSDSGYGGGGGFDALHPDIEQTLSEKVSLRDHLISQLTMDLSDPVDRLIGLHLIDMLDEAGYMTGDLVTVAQVLSCPVERVEATLTRLQQFDPPGIFARSLSECLALQLMDLDRLDPCMQTFLDNLDLLAGRDLAGLEKACGVDAEDIADMIAEIKALDPKPALAFDHTVAQPITPDVLMRRQPGGGWILDLNSETLPRVLVNNQYHARISGGTRTKSEKQYIAEQLQSANWLVKSLHQRATTILKVASELVRQQDGFFAHGVQHLKPLVLRDIAEEIDMHESTVSRVTSNKYIATPRGIYELKYFFTPAISATGGGEAHSAESVRHRIKALIDEESVKKVLSDDKIVSLLRAEGIDIARRTVAKYREAMGIYSSVQRRREKTAVT
jgi:RNA polymerase sigma-54 factor